MGMATQKKIASELLKCGVTRVKIHDSKEVEEALTRNDIRDLIKKGAITKIQKKGTSRAYAKVKLAQKKKGRQKGDGRRKGAAGARTDFKGVWIDKVRSLRRLLKNMRDNNQLDRSDYRILYLRSKGGFFRDKKHILSYIKEKELLRAKKPRTVKKIVNVEKPKIVEKPTQTKKMEKKKETKKKETKKKEKSKK